MSVTAARAHARADLGRDDLRIEIEAAVPMRHAIG